MKNQNPMTEALQALFLAFPAQERTGTERQMAEIYRLAVEGIPAGFVVMACKRFIQGQVERPNLQFRPTPPELAEECRRLREQEQKRQRYAELPSRDLPRMLPAPRQPFRPYPRLWEAFAGEPEVVKKLEALSSFDKVTTASRTLATQGIDAARAYIMAERPSGRPGPPRMTDKPGPVIVGKVNVDDFPPGTATAAELRAWEQRQRESEATEETP